MSLNINRRSFTRVAASLPFAGLSQFASAQAAFPIRPIKCLVPFPAGGTLELIGRHVGQRVQAQLGQPLVFENKPGAAGQLAASIAARAPADGYNLLLGNDPAFSIIPALGTTMQFNPETDFAPVSLLCQASLALVTASDFPAKNLQELLIYAKANPGKIAYASAGIGSQHHIAMERFMGKVGIDMIHIPYQGIAPAFNSLLAGDTKILFAALTLPLPHIATGKVKALAVTGAQRHPLLPAVPTFMEQGIADYVISAWFGMFAPAATPTPIVKHMSSVVWAAVSSKDFIDNVLLKIGFELNTAITPERFAAFLREDRQRWKESVAQIDPKKLVQ
jgi:tripartite-type tricarboxylate transporter receptor subunit TctC